MNENNFIVVSIKDYKKKYKGDISKYIDYINLDKFIVISSMTNEVIDDAQGWGFSTKQNAYKCRWWKTKSS